MNKPRIGDWIQTYPSGKQFWPIDPRPEEVDIKDIAWSLSMQCRYGGHVNRFYSVAEHSYHISWALGRMGYPYDVQLYGLLHDAAETYCIDVPGPVKRSLVNYKLIENQIMRAICIKFGLAYEEPAIVKELDSRILVNESRALLKPAPAPWGVENLEPLPDLDIEKNGGWDQRRAFLMFAERFKALNLLRKEMLDDNRNQD